jgi:2-polyprenyl-6-hydroxyphenyl methylase/3-demethylubiquinone-9 3-methyltransferase
MSEYGYHNAKCGYSSPYILPVVREILRGIPPHAVVADLGCGNGSMLAQFQQHEWELHGLELSRSGLAEAVKADPGIRFEHADLTTDLSSHALAGKCDVVISTEVVEHVFLPRTYAKNCHSLLKPNGVLIVSTPYHGYLKNLTMAVTGRMDAHFTALWDYGHIKFWSQRTLKTLLEEAGFGSIRFQGVGRVPLLWKSMIAVARSI